MTYGLIGEHLPHSFSKEIHGKCASYEYELHELAHGAVGAFMEAADFCAINVTIPYKQTVMSYLYEIHEQARAIGAVNTVVNRDGKLYGYNTDFYGMLALVRHIGVEIKDKKVLILGTGGTAHTARALATSEGVRCVLTVGRSVGEGVISYEEAYTDHTDAEIIINTTPCGMFPYADGGSQIAGTPIDITRFPRLEGVVDVVYNPIRTNLVMNAKAAGVPAEGGLYMLVGQAVVASRVFLGEEIEQVAADTETYETIDRIYGEIVKDKENIVLIGMPGSGKSTVGKQLADAMGRPFLDTDALIVERTGKAISDIFAEVGEAGFREIESEVVKDTANNSTGCVIATGGGAILRDDNVRALARGGRIYFLDRPLEALLPTEDRPLASTADAIRRRYAERYERYCATADVRVENGRAVEEAVSMIREDFFA
jgi:shikimate dehydrogenase